MSWVRVSPEQLFFLFGEKKELFGLVVLPCLIFIGLRVFMHYAYMLYMQYVYMLYMLYVYMLYMQYVYMFYLYMHVYIVHIGLHC